MKTVELGRSGKRSRPRQLPENENLFGWTVFILLLCGFAVACWIGTFYVFTHPEEPFNYHILEKLKKLDPPKRFALTAAPTGEFMGPDKLLAKYGAMSSWQIDEESKNLLRSFLRNYDHQVGKIPYVTGRFTVLDSFPLVRTNFCDSGAAVIAQSVDVPTIYLEHLFPAGAEQLPAMQRTLTTGLGIELRRSYDLSAIIHIENIGGGRLLFTCIPLLYGPYGTTQGTSGFQLDPPKSVNLKAGLPLVSLSQVRDAELRLAQYRRAMASQATASAHPAVKSQPSLVNAEPSLAASPSATGPAESARSPKPAVPVGKTNPREIAAASPSIAPKALSVATATPTKVAESSQPLQPFLTASPTPAASGRVVDLWQTYRPGQMPRGRLLDVDQTTELAERGIGNATIYLRGDFMVTAARENRAVLRPRQSLADHVLNRGNARIIVEYPRGIPTPQEGDTFQRTTDRPFQIVDVRRGTDGQVNIYVREVTTPE
ncbi:MAG: hypothetical protein JOZ60_07560 [Verrucomicrobia bacterium]|nr:hypothetical protein [Verrucomicrobiota bacterium]